MRRDIVQKAGGFRSQFDSAQDYDLFYNREMMMRKIALSLTLLVAFTALAATEHSVSDIVLRTPPERRARGRNRSLPVQADR